MQQNNLLLAQIVEHTPIGIVVIRADGNMCYVNNCAEQIFNRTQSALIGKPVGDFLSELSGAGNWNEILASILQKKITETIVTIHPDKRKDVVSKLNVFNIHGTDHYPESFALMFRDITQEMRVDEQIEKKNLEITKMNSELIRSNVELKRVSDLKSNFLSIASHELKTPLTSIKGYSDIIIDNMKNKIDSGVYRMIESINRAADRLHKVVNNILDVTRIEQKRLRLKPEMINLGDIANDCIEELAHFLLQRGIVFRCTFSENLPEFYGDKIRMQQVFTNLFSNALKFSPDGSNVDISISTDKPGRIHIIIKDYGIGIDKNEHKNIFDPFYEIGNSNRHSTDFSKFMGGGTGLGLSIVKGIVERHGGKIWVVSDGVKENNFPGSEFHIDLPIVSEISWDDDETKALANGRYELDKNEKSLTIEEKPTILFIDADREAVEIARMVLDNAFDTLVAETGEAGLTLAFQHRPSVILLDSNLPGIDGYRVCRILRTQDETRDIPIAFFSAGTQTEEIQRCFTSGADDFVVKPFSGRELVEKIWRLIMKKKAVDVYK